jgi:hypothetical protein
MKLYFVVQVTRNDTVLGVRGIHFEREVAECDLFDAEQMPKSETGWPVWRIKERECEDL